jgi:heme/copper-type cytochrome/quinol oxidase subunit 2
MKHAIVVRELRLQNRIKVGEIKTIEFAPKRAGTFDVICGEFCGAGHASMVGKLIVTE